MLQYLKGGPRLVEQDYDLPRVVEDENGVLTASSRRILYVEWINIASREVSSTGKDDVDSYFCGDQLSDL